MNMDWILEQVSQNPEQIDIWGIRMSIWGKIMNMISYAPHAPYIS